MSFDRGARARNGLRCWNQLGASTFDIFDTTFDLDRPRRLDALIVKMTGAKTKSELITACKALDRVIGHNYLLLPQWSAATHRLAYNAWKLQKPPQMPPYAQGETWAMDTWWAQ